MFNNDYDVLTAYEAMDYLGVGENTLYKLLNSGELKAFRIGRVWKIPRKEIEKYIDKSVKK
jgi:excisionase family DNA binding protein